MIQTIFRACVVASCGTFGCFGYASAAFAQTNDAYPNRPIRLVVPTAAGAGSDVMARALASHLSASLGQPVVIDNRPGAAGTIGLTAVKIAPPDGYTLAFGNTSSIVNAPLLSEPPAYEPAKDFEPIAAVYRSLIVLISNAQGSGMTLKEFFEYARQNPAKLNYSSPGPGSFAHLWIEMMKRQQGIDIVHVPYKGAGPALQAFIAGEAHFNLAETTILASTTKAANLRLLAQMGEQRGALLANVPTVREAGFPELTSDFWFGTLAPKGTPARIIKRLNEEMNKTMALPEMKARVTAAGGEAIIGDAESFGRTLAADTRHWTPIVKQLGLKAQ